MYDCIIVGMGPAGMSAAIYAKRSGMKTLILDAKSPGGLLHKISSIENYPGFPKISGADLSLNMFEHLIKENVEYKIEQVMGIENNGEYKTIITTKNKYKTKGLILAVGRKTRRSGIPNEEKFRGKGVSYCAICDGTLYKNKDIVILGGGNSAFEESIYLSTLAKSITIIIKNNIIAENSFVEEATKRGIKILENTEIDEFVGDDVFEGVKLKDGNVIKCDGAFVYYGYNADISILNNLNIKNDNGYIIVDEKMKTSVDHIYACGDIIKKDIYQIVTACSEGTIAALSLKKEINK